MKRRELLLVSLSAAFLAACGGAKNEETITSVTSSGSSGKKKSEPSFNSAEHSRFILAYVGVLVGDAKTMDRYRANNGTYFSALGFSAQILSDHSALLKALPLLTTIDSQTAIDIGDVDYILEICSSTGLLSAKQIEAFRRTASSTKIAALVSNSPTTELATTLANLISVDAKKLFQDKPTLQNLPALLVLLMAQVMQITNTLNS